MRSYGLVALAVLLLLPAPLLAAEDSRPYLGVAVGPATENDSGVEIRDIHLDSPAARAGLRRGDIIARVQDKEVKDARAFLAAIAERKPGEKVSLSVRRDGKEQLVSVTLGSQPAPGALGSDERQFPAFPLRRAAAFLGVETEELTPELKRHLGVEVDAGVMVATVVEGSPADRAGLKREDVITAVDGAAVKSPLELRRAVEKAGVGKEVSLDVLRGKEKRTVKATLAAGPANRFFWPDREGFPMLGVESLWDQGSQLRALQRRVEALEKRLSELEKKQERPR